MHPYSLRHVVCLMQVLMEEIEKALSHWGATGNQGASSNL
jgi:hypothetical protein